MSIALPLPTCENTPIFDLGSPERVVADRKNGYEETKARRIEEDNLVVIPRRHTDLVVFGNEARRGVERGRRWMKPPSLPLSFSLPTILLRVRRISADMRTDECEIELRLHGARGRPGRWAYGSTRIETMVKGSRGIAGWTGRRRCIGSCLSPQPGFILLKPLLFLGFRIVRVGLAHRHDRVVVFRVDVVIVSGVVHFQRVLRAWLKGASDCLLFKLFRVILVSSLRLVLGACFSALILL
jgi:hypothetical protein